MATRDHLSHPVAALSDLAIARQEAATLLSELKEAEQYVAELRDEFVAAHKVVNRLKKRESRLRTGRN
jgi:hypothetical protein